MAVWIGAAPEWSSFAPEEEGGIELFWADPSYPANAAITIPNNADFNQDGLVGLEIGFDFYIDNLFDSNIICKYDPTGAVAAEFFLGIFNGKLAFQVWDSDGIAFGDLNLLSGEFVGKWMRCYIKIASSASPAIVLLIAPMGSSISEAIDFNISCGSVSPNSVTYELAAFPGTTRAVATNDILCSPEGRIRNLYFSKTGDLSISYFFNTEPYIYISMIDHYYPLNDDTTGAGTVTDIIAGLDGDYDVDRVAWDNHSEDPVFVPSMAWSAIPYPGIYAKAAVIDREVLALSPSEYVVERTSRDMRNVANWSIPGAPKLINVADDGATGTVFTFNEPLKSNRQYKIYANVPMDNLAGGTVPVGYFASFHIEDTDLPVYEIDTISSRPGVAHIMFNTNIKPFAKVSGVDVAWIDWLPNGMIIWTNDVGRKELVISAVEDLSGNIMATQTVECLFPEASRLIEFDGQMIKETLVVKDDLESKFSRQAQNAVEQ